MDALAPFERGKTFYGSNVRRPTAPTNGTTDPYGDNVRIEGMIHEFDDVDLASTTAYGIKKLRSERKVLCQLVRNVSGVTLQPGMAVVWKTGYAGKRVAGYSNTTACEVAGIVDDQIPVGTGVPTNDLFWLIVQGPCLVYSPISGPSAAWVEGDSLYAVTAAASTGAFSANAATGATGAASDEEGRLINWAGTFTAAQTTDGTAAKIMANRVAICMSACTTGSTGAALQKLVDVVLKAR